MWSSLTDIEYFFPQFLLDYSLIRLSTSCLPRHVWVRSKQEPCFLCPDVLTEELHVRESFEILPCPAHSVAVCCTGGGEESSVRSGAFTSESYRLGCAVEVVGIEKKKLDLGL